MKDKIYKLLPNFLQNFLIFIYNKKAYKTRYGGEYWKFREEKEKNRRLTLNELKEYQRKRYKSFIESAIQHSDFYKNTLAGIENVTDLENIRNLPIVNKEDLRLNIKKVVIKTTERSETSKTGGTTGKSLEVRILARNNQERFAFLDDFRSRFGYELGKKTAWFSGKSLLTNKDLKRNRFWKTDPIHQVRYYSTFHIKNEYLKYYVEDLFQFQPEYFVGFPSTILEIAQYGIQNEYEFPAEIVKAIFPTAETVTPVMRNTIESFFKTKIYDQYASSEGAPFIFECEKENLHLELQSGVFEILDDQNQSTQSGRLVLTSFTTEATPLIRYDIGDSITLDDPNKICGCGNNNPLVKEILGRIDDYIYSPENGKINLGNISNTLKGTSGIIKFQAVQDKLSEIEVKIVTDQDYSKTTEKVFTANWRDRIGEKMKFEIKIVEDIPVEASGKYRIVKNNIKHLIE